MPCIPEVRTPVIVQQQREHAPTQHGTAAARSRRSGWLAAKQTACACVMDFPLIYHMTASTTTPAPSSWFVGISHTPNPFVGLATLTLSPPTPRPQSPSGQARCHGAWQPLHLAAQQVKDVWHDDVAVSQPAADATQPDTRVLAAGSWQHACTCECMHTRS